MVKLLGLLQPAGEHVFKIKKKIKKSGRQVILWAHKP